VEENIRLPRSGLWGFKAGGRTYVFEITLRLMVVGPQHNSPPRITAVDPGGVGVQHTMSTPSVSIVCRGLTDGLSAFRASRGQVCLLLRCCRSKSHDVDIGAAPRVVEGFISDFRIHQFASHAPIARKTAFL
jgi:hypothetical protein